MYKVFAACALLAAVSAGPADHQATSFASFNDNHNSVNHIQSAVAPLRYSAPSAYSYTPSKVAIPVVPKVAVPAAPVYQTGPAHQNSYDSPAPNYYNAPAPQYSYSAPAPKYTSYASAPVATVPARQYSYASPAPKYYNAPVPQYSYSAPAPKYASYASGPVAYAPVAKVALPVVAKPVAKYVAAPAYKAQYDEQYGPAKYEFAYAVEDAHTSDFHSQQEQRDGDHVVGQYSLHEADGTVRLVKYSDEGHGFNAVVERQGHPTEVPVAYKKIVAAAPSYYHH